MPVFVPGFAKPHERIVAFTTRQLLDIFAPSNVPVLNPEVLAATRATAGENLPAGGERLGGQAGEVQEPVRSGDAERHRGEPAAEGRLRRVQHAVQTGGFGLFSRGRAFPNGSWPGVHHLLVMFGRVISRLG